MRSIEIKFTVEQEADFSSVPEDMRRDCLEDVDFAMSDDYSEVCKLKYSLKNSEIKGETAKREVQIGITLPWTNKDEFKEQFGDDFGCDEESGKLLLDIDGIIRWGLDGFDVFFVETEDGEEETIQWDCRVLDVGADSDQIAFDDWA